MPSFLQGLFQSCRLQGEGSCPSGGLCVAAGVLSSAYWPVFAGLDQHCQLFARVGMAGLPLVPYHFRWSFLPCVVHLRVMTFGVVKGFQAWITNTLRAVRYKFPCCNHEPTLVDETKYLYWKQPPLFPKVLPSLLIIQCQVGAQ